MRLPHHLVRHPSGVYHFRLLVPADLRTAFGLKVIKQSLRTRSLAAAQGWAYVLSARYAQAFADSREQGGAMGANLRDDLRVARFEIRRGADGAFAMSTNGTPEDNTAALTALGLMVAHAGPTTGATGVRSGPSKAPTLGMAIRSYAQIEAPNLKPNTWEQRRRNFELFLKALGGGQTVDSITRPMAAAWADDLQRSGLSMRYVANCVSHVAQLFEVQLRARAKRPRAWRELSHDVTFWQRAVADVKAVVAAQTGTADEATADAQRVGQRHRRAAARLETAIYTYYARGARHGAALLAVMNEAERQFVEPMLADATGETAIVPPVVEPVLTYRPPGMRPRP